MTQTNILRILYLYLCPHAKKNYDKIKKDPYLPNLIFNQWYLKHTIIIIFHKPNQEKRLNVYDLNVLLYQ